MQKQKSILNVLVRHLHMDPVYVSVVVARKVTIRQDESKRDELIPALRTVVEKGKGSLDKN